MAGLMNNVCNNLGFKLRLVRNIYPSRFSTYLSPFLFMKFSIPSTHFQSSPSCLALLLFSSSSVKSKSTANHGNNLRQRIPGARRSSLGNAHMISAGGHSHKESEAQFEKWTQTLQRGFQPEDVAEVLKQERDREVAFDIFRWASQQKRYKHNHLTYEHMIRKLSSTPTLQKMEILIDEVMAGVCDGSESLFNTIIFACIQSGWLSRAISVYRHMWKTPDCKPSLKTYNLLLSALVNKKNNNNSYISHMHMQNMRALFKQMIDGNVAPDIFTLNVMIKGYAKSLHMNDALRIFHQMDLYGCTPNAYTYNYLISGLCLQSRTINAMQIYEEMIVKGFAPSNMVYNSLINSLSLAGELEQAIGILREMVDKLGVPEFITYKTLVDGLCREGKGLEAKKLLLEFRQKDRSLDGISYRKLLNHLHSRIETID